MFEHVKSGRIYLIPTPLTEDDTPLGYMPEYNREVLLRLGYFVVEQVRTARRFLSRAKLGLEIDGLTFAELNEHTPSSDLEMLLLPVLQGRDCGLMSEAGVPGVADPGAGLVSLAHDRNIEVVPLIGPSSILLSLMASGMNGQTFSFNGYLPVKPNERRVKLRELEKKARQLDQTQLFIETPYRNDALFTDMLDVLDPDIRLCVAAGLTAPGQYIKTRTVRHWRTGAKPELHKVPAVFIIGR